MNCESVRKNLSFFLYGELALEDEQAFQDHIEACAACRQELEKEKTLHSALDARELAPPPELLVRCRQDLLKRVSPEHPRRAGVKQWIAGLLDLRLAALARPVGALALVVIGFFAARWTAPGGGPLVAANAPGGALRVRYVQPEDSGRVRLVVEETTQRTLTGTPDDAQIRGLLLATARESIDPGLRAESMEVLKARRSGGELKPVLLSALQHDPNPGVRLKALDALKPFAGDQDVREALSSVLLADDNPGVRTQAIDLLAQQKADDAIPVCQELVQREQNGYVRLRCQRALEELNASVGTF